MTASSNDGILEEIANPPEGDSWWADDSDGDGMTNAEEVLFLSDPYRLDSDFDGLADRDERDLTPPVLFGGLSHTDPWDWDSNNNGYSDHDEYFYTLQVRVLDVNYNSLVQFYSYSDADGDGIHNQDDADPVTMDRDGDGLVNWQDSYMDDYYNGNPPPVDPWYYADDDNDGTINGNDPYPSDWWNGQPHYYWDGAERAGTWSDQDGDGTPDDFDPTPVPGYTYNGTFYAGAWSDRDGDSVPDPADPTPDGTYWYNGQEYPGPWADSDSDGIPNPADSIDSSNSHWYNGTEYSGPFADSDGDSIPNSADSWPSDPENGLDSDGDGLDNYTELNNTHTNASDVDSDDDYLTDGEEALVTHTNPKDPTTGENQTALDFFAFSGPDTDNDGLPDLVENHYTATDVTNPNTWLTPNGDLDGDGVSNLQAYWFGWDLLAYLNQYDMDGDCMTDAQEDYWSALHPGILDRAVFADAVADPDGDGLMNFEELAMNADPGTARSLNPDVVDGQLRAWQQYTTTPYQWGYDWSLMTDAWSTPVYLPCPAAYLESYDWDGNGLPDGYDAYVATYGPPPIPAAVPPDADGDGMPNLWEHRHGLRLRDARDAQSTPLAMPPQPQAQDFVDWERYNADYPGGGGNHLIYVDVSAYQNAFHAYILACDAAATHPGCDPDSDTLSNLQEHQHQTHPKIADSDGDGDLDSMEVMFGCSPISRANTLSTRINELRISIAQKLELLDQALQSSASRQVLTQLYGDLMGLEEELSAIWEAAICNSSARAGLEMDGGVDRVNGDIAIALMKMEDDPHLEARTRRLMEYSPDVGTSNKTGYWSEKPYSQPPEGRQPPYEITDFLEPVTSNYSTQPFPAWDQSARGHAEPMSAGFCGVAQSFANGPEQADAEFRHTEVRLYRVTGMQQLQRFYRLRYQRTFVDGGGDIREETSHCLVVLGITQGGVVSTGGAILPLGNSGVPSGVSVDGGTLRMAPSCEIGVWKEVFLEPCAGPVVRLYRYGEPPTSGNPMVVLRLSTLVFELDPGLSEFQNLSDGVKWEISRMSPTGAWGSYSEVGSGRVFNYQALTAGIFRLRAKVNDSLTIDLVRQGHDVYWDPDLDKKVVFGPGRAGAADAFGVVSTSLQKAIWTAARAHLLSKSFGIDSSIPARYGFGSVAAGAYKCNIYVAHSAREAGALVPKINGLLVKNDPPRAAQWFGMEDTNPAVAGMQTDIAGWSAPASSPPEPGTICARGGAPGHCGIVDYDGYALSASSVQGIINRKFDLRLAKMRRSPIQ